MGGCDEKIGKSVDRFGNYLIQIFCLRFFKSLKRQTRQLAARFLEEGKGWRGHLGSLAVHLGIVRLLSIRVIPRLLRWSKVALL